MENKFKVGDLVECIAEDNLILTFGDEYMIKEVLPDDDDYDVVVFDNGCRCKCSADIFKLVKREQEPNYMMCWNFDEKEAEKREVLLDGRNNVRVVDVYPIIVLTKNGGFGTFKCCKSIEQWKKDTGFVFENTLNERFFQGDMIYWVRKETNALESDILDDYDLEDLGEHKVSSEAMTKESAEKYIKEHEIIEPLSVHRDSMKKSKVKYRPFTMEEFDKVDIRLIHKEFKRRDTVAYYGSEVVTMYGDDTKLSYTDILRIYTLLDGAPCGVKE